MTKDASLMTWPEDPWKQPKAKQDHLSGEHQRSRRGSTSKVQAFDCGIPNLNPAACFRLIQGMSSNAHA